jgi:pimeloyl-ACP methyl ester carboxylesterase
MSKTRALILGVVFLASTTVWAGGLRCSDLFTKRSNAAVQTYVRSGAKFSVMPVLQGYKMAFRDEKPKKWNGKTYVFTPGLSETSSFYDSHAAALLQSGFRVVRLEPLNIGESLIAQRGPIADLGLEVDAAAQAEVIKSLNLKPGSVVLVGHSRGGAISLIISALFEPHFFSRIYLSNSYVRWLPPVYKEQTSAQLLATARMMNWFNPWSYNPLTAGMVDASAQMLSKFYANLGVDMAMGMTNFEGVVRHHIQNRDPSKATGLPLATEVAGVMAQYNAMRDSSILVYAQSAGDRGVDVRVGVAERDALMPQLTINELTQALGVHSVHGFRGGHMTPIEQFHSFMAWITTP